MLGGFDIIFLQEFCSTIEEKSHFSTKIQLSLLLYLNRNFEWQSWINRRLIAMEMLDVKLDFIETQLPSKCHHYIPDRATRSIVRPHFCSLRRKKRRRYQLLAENRSTELNIQNGVRNFSFPNETISIKC